MAVDGELQRWLTLQSKLQELAKSEGWDAFCAVTKTRADEALADLRREGATRHDYNTGFLDGLDWLTKYPDFAAAAIQKYRKLQP